MQTRLLNGVSDSEAAPRKIYPVLAQHQRDEEWNGREIVAVLQLWAERFIVEFKLDIAKVVLCVDRLSAKRYGHFRYGHNGFGLKGEIAINSRYLLGARPAWQILGTLLHELLHGWQQAHGHPSRGNHHNAEFRDKARGLGLIVDRRGVTGYAAQSPFKDLLRRFGIVVPDEEVLPVVEREPGRSKLNRWACGCTNVWVAVPHFHARCLDCGSEFVRGAVVRNRKRPARSRSGSELISTPGGVISKGEQV